MLIIVSILFTSCSLKEANTNFKDEIKGDWVTNYFIDNQTDKIFVFSFDENKCSYVHPYGEFSNYTISNDTLIINERISKRRNNQVGGKEKYHFRILHLKDDNLEITPITKESKSLFKYFEHFDYDTINLKRKKKKNNVQFEHIGFYSTDCYGPCPSMYLELNKDGRILFKGNRYTENDGLYSGQINKSELQKVIDRIHQLEIDSLQKKYTASWTDDQTCGIKIKTLDNEYESSAYGFNKEPVELRILFHTLMELYKRAELKQDSTITSKFTFQEFSPNKYPPPRLPKTKINKK